MSKNNNRLGGEESGHIIFSKYATTGDGILTSLMLMEVMISKNQPMSKLYEGFESYPQIRINVNVNDKSSIMTDPEILSLIEKTKEKLGDNGRILVRESGTEPMIRVMVEADSIGICKSYAESVADAIESKNNA
jgi:phosphoglucosamine mutase